MSLFIGNVSSGVTVRDLEDVFNEVGKCKIKHFGKYAFAEYETDQDADEAMSKLQGKELMGRKLNLEYSKQSKKFSGTSKPEKSRSRSKERKCFNCNSSNHIMKNCPEERRKRDSKERERDRDRRDRRDDRDERDRRRVSRSRSRRRYSRDRRDRSIDRDRDRRRDRSRSRSYRRKDRRSYSRDRRQDRDRRDRNYDRNRKYNRDRSKDRREKSKEKPQRDNKSASHDSKPNNQLEALFTDNHSKSPVKANN